MSLAFRRDAHFGMTIADSDTAGSVNQNIVERVADASAQRAEPAIGEFPGREGIGGSRGGDIRFSAKHELPSLPVVTALHPARDAGRVGRVPRRVAPLIAKIAAQIGAGPAVAAHRRRHGVIRRAARKIGGPGYANSQLHRERANASPHLWHGDIQVSSLGPRRPNSRLSWMRLKPFACTGQAGAYERMVRRKNDGSLNKSYGKSEINLW